MEHPDPKEREEPVPEAQDPEGEDGYGSVDEDEKPDIDQQEVLSNPG